MQKKYCDHCGKGTFARKEGEGCFSQLAGFFAAGGFLIGLLAEGNVQAGVAGMLVLGMPAMIVLGLPIWGMRMAFRSESECGECGTRYRNYE